MHIRVAGLALPVVIAIGAAATSCGAPGTAKPAASATRSAPDAAVPGISTASQAARTSPGSVPAGYTRVGGAAQGISIAVPASWVTVDLATESPQSAVSKAGLSGESATSLLQQLEFLQKSHDIFVFDGKSAVERPRPSGPILTAYCGTSGTTEVGAAGLPFLKKTELSQLEQVVVAHVTVKDLEIGGIPGVELSYDFPSADPVPLTGSALAVLPKPGKVCNVIEGVPTGQSLGSVLSVAATTAQFP